MTTRDGLVVVAIAAAITITVDLVTLLAVKLLARRPHRPPPPDVLLPDGWRRWYPDGQGYERLYRWHNGRWHEVPRHRMKVPTDEPA